MRPVLAVSGGDEGRGIDAQVTVSTSYRFQQKERLDVLFKKGATPGSIRCRTAAVRAVKTASEH